MSSSEWSLPGKVLFIDNDINEVKKFIDKLTESSVSVQFWDPNKPLSYSTSNVRIVILDLNLKKSEDIRGTPSFYIPAVEALGSVTGPYILYIFSDGFEESKDIKGLSEAYEDKYKRSINTIGKIIGIEKGQTDVKKFIDTMNNGFQETDIFKMISIWDNLLNDAKDRALLRLSEDDFDKEIKQFVKSIANGIDDNSLPREFNSNMIRFVSRHINAGSEFEKLTKILTKIKNSKNEEIKNAILQHLQMYYVPDKTEKIWTGDILKMKSGLDSSSKDLWDYSIVMTPACDIAQSPSRKLETFLMCFGFKIDVDGVKNPDHPIRKNISAFKFPIQQTGQSVEDWNKEISKAIYDGIKNNLPPRYFVIWHLKDEKDNYFGICFDFQRVASHGVDMIENSQKDNRVCRLDSPFIDELLQKFGSYSYRLGTPDINLPSRG